jgi:5-methyltetrahydrofolate--homocysteine methyltransferase
MVIIGELINSTRQKIRDAMEKKDANYIKGLAQRQDKAGAAFIDVNAGAFVYDELEKLEWALNQVQEATRKPLAIDSPRAEAIRLGLKLHKNGKPFINSITKESERWKQVFPLAVENDAYVLGLCIDDRGIPEDSDTRARIASGIVEDLVKAGKKIEDIAIDPLTTPLSVNSRYGMILMDTIRMLKKSYPEVKVITGLSNISFGLPARKQVNRAFMIACMAAGLDGALIDPLDQVMMSLVRAADALLNRDPYCANFLKAYRAGMISTD